MKSARSRVSSIWLPKGSHPQKDYPVLKQPEALKEDGDMATNWREWKTMFDYYLIASGKENVTSREKHALFIHVIGKTGWKVLDEVYLDNEVENDYHKLVSIFSNYFDPPRNVNCARNDFFETFQNENSFDEFYEELKLKSRDCEFGQLRSSMIVTQIIRGMNDFHMRETLFHIPKLDLKQIVKWCRVTENGRQQQEDNCIIHVENAVEQDNRTGEQSAPQPPTRYRRASKYNLCDYCGSKHGIGDKCPAWDALCYSCERLGHFARMCNVKMSSL